ncbi:ATP-binding protein [Bradyrhizobium sp. HKCCYLS2038]|uniref:ATP-binding protein n=1 Tax=unclassified Bradyrhizobium TaxID=2631580 RepID=UPI003EB80F78
MFGTVGVYAAGRTKNGRFWELTVVELSWLIPHAHLLKLGLNVEVHAFVELFCGVVSFLIAGLLFATTVHNRRLPTALFGMAFLLSGTLDTLHAGTNPVTTTELFIVFHTLSTSCGAIFMIAGVMVQLHTSYRTNNLKVELRVVGFLALALACIVAFSLVFDNSTNEKSFDDTTQIVHLLAGALFVVAAFASFNSYLASREALWLVIAGELLVLSVSVLLFRLSSLWSEVWWLWHFVKALFYVGALLIITVQFALMVRRNELSRQALAEKHVELAHAHTRLGNLVGGLQVRNWMTNKATSAFGLDATLAVIASALRTYLDVQHINLVLFAPVDEVDENQCRFGYVRDDWRVSVVPRPVKSNERDPSTSETWLSRHSGEDTTELQFTLRANDRQLGYISVPVSNMALVEERWDHLSDLAAEMGQIFYNTLIYEQLMQESMFREGLFRIVLELRSTLEQKRLRMLFCDSAASLLDSDSAAILVKGESGREIGIGSCGKNHAAVADGMGPWLSQRLEQPASLELKPVGWVTGRDVTAEDPLPTGLPSCAEGTETAAHAMFPLVEDGHLVGAVVVSRCNSIRFSNATLQKGQLLIQQLELALENAKSCDNLRQANLRLRKTEKRKLVAERLSALGEVAATVAHEIRNPLGAIVNCATVLRSVIPDHPKAQTALMIIEEETQRLERLIKNFLNVGKPAGTVALQLMSVRDHSRKICNVVRKHVDSRKLPIAVSCEFRGDDRLVLFDADGFREVLMNLMLNAVQAIDAEGHVVVKARQKPTHFFVVVLDNGRGISPSRREQLFEPFVTERSEGAGLGLAIVRRLIHGWGGTIRIWGALGGGSCFAVLVPLCNDGHDRVRHAEEFRIVASA